MAQESVPFLHIPYYPCQNSLRAIITLLSLLYREGWRIGGLSYPCLCVSPLKPHRTANGVPNIRRTEKFSEKIRCLIIIDIYQGTMNKEDELTVKRIINRSVQGVLAINQVKRHVDYFLCGELPIIYQYEECITKDDSQHNHDLIHSYIETLRDSTKCVLDSDKQHSFNTAAEFITYTLFRVFGERMKDRAITNLCIVPVPTEPSQPAHYAEWNQVLDCVEWRTGVRNCTDAYYYWGVRNPEKHKESDGLPDGFIDIHSLVNAESKYANVILVIDRMFRGDEMLEMKRKLEENGHNVILGICLCQEVP